jgi:putative ABC transport system substrate-binding protein
VIGYLSSRSPDDTAHLVAAFRRGLGENGFVEGQNVTIEYRWALGQYDRLPAMASELVRHPVTVLTTTSERHQKMPRLRLGASRGIYGIG